MSSVSRKGTSRHAERDVYFSVLGIAGAAIASSLWYTFVSLIMAWCYLRETGVSWRALVPRRGDRISGHASYGWDFSPDDQLVETLG